jgi:hypothetical protein
MRGQVLFQVILDDFLGRFIDFELVVLVTDK